MVPWQDLHARLSNRKTTQDFLGSGPQPIDVQVHPAATVWYSAEGTRTLGELTVMLNDYSTEMKV